MSVKVHVATDHRGFDLKEKLKNQFDQVEWVDHGPDSADRVNYPDYADKVAALINQNPSERGLLICGSGQGMAMRANKYQNVRAGLVWSKESTELCRQHNNANVLCVGADLLEHSLIEELLSVFLETEFEGGRHEARVDMISQELK